MRLHKKPRSLQALSPFAVVAFVLIASCSPAQASDPHSAYYSSANDRLFWFIQISDIHIGASGAQDQDYLTWIVTEAKRIIEPEFIVASGDLTDSTNGNLLGYPNGPYQTEWDQYKAILANKVDPSNYYDIPGNHDAYNDQYFQYYLANSVQGRATGQTQLSWTRTFPFGTYHFLAVNSADNSGDPFSLSPPWGDYAGLDATELAFINNQLALHQDAVLTLVFGHHPVTATGDSQDTYLYYGASEFITYLDRYGASLYGYGHTHRFAEDLFAGDSYTGYMAGNGVFYLNVPSLGKSGDWHYSIVAVDCNGISSVTEAKGSWPVVLVTAPVGKFLGAAPNPYSYPVPEAPNSIRALVFDVNPITSVKYRINGTSDWHPMTQTRPEANPHLWEASWNASGLAPGDCTIEVQASSNSGVKTDLITVLVEAVSGCGDDVCGPDEDSCNCPSDCGGPPVELCSDGVDNDCDGYIDCNDVECLADSGCRFGDTTPPELISLSISPLTIDTSGGPATVFVKIEALDDLSGFGSTSTGNGSIDVRHTAESNHFGRESLPITRGTILNPIFEFSLTAPQASPQGIYPISLTLTDNAFNSVTFSSSDLAALGFPSQIEVTSIGDTTPPQLIGFSISPLTIDTSDGPATLSVRIEALDDLSGFGSTSTGSGSIDIRHTSGSDPFGRGSLPITGGTALNPIFEFSLAAPQASPQGIYPISLTLIDNVFNSVTFSSSDLAALGFPSQIEIISNLPVCGNQIVESGEQCDDGNTQSGDGCSATCQLEGAGTLDATGVFRPSNGLIYLKKENTTGYADRDLVYGIPGDLPIAGDWEGDGIDSIGVYRNGVFYLKNSNETGYADMVFAFGANGDLPVAGDWDGDGIDTIGVYRNGLFMLRNTNDSGPAEMQFALGIPGDVPIAGNWDGAGGDSCGVFRPTNGLIYLKNENSTGYADIEIVFGIPNDKPIVGDWDGDGIDTIGVYREGAFLLRNSNETGYAEMYFGLGIDGDVPISGKWGLP